MGNSSEPADIDLRELRRALKQFHETNPFETWRRLGATLLLLALVWPLAFLDVVPMLARVLAGVLAGGLMLRLCSFGHDYLHGSLLPRSPVARVVISMIGGLVLAPPQVWKDTHNLHHAHNGRMPVKAVGTFPLVTVARLKSMSPGQRRAYYASRSPWVILLGWPLIFGIALNLRNVFRSPSRYYSSALTLVVHTIAHVAVIVGLGWVTWAVAMVLPFTLLGAMGAYLFYAQHTYPDCEMAEADAWEVRHSALAASSYMGMPGWMHWFSGNIGYHHIHHFDVRVPFYRLPEAFAAIPALQRPPDTSFRLADIRAALRLVAWDPARGRLVAREELGS